MSFFSSRDSREMIWRSQVMANPSQELCVWNIYVLWPVLFCNVGHPKWTNFNQAHNRSSVMQWSYAYNAFFVASFVLSPIFAVMATGFKSCFMIINHNAKGHVHPQTCATRRPCGRRKKNGRAAGIKLLDKDVNQILRGNSTDIQKGGRVMRGMAIWSFHKSVSRIIGINRLLRHFSI